MFFLVFCFFYFFLVLGLFSLVCLPPHAPLPVVLPTACPPSHFFLGFGFVFSCVLASACFSSRCIAYCISLPFTLTVVLLSPPAAALSVGGSHCSAFPVDSGEGAGGEDAAAAGFVASKRASWARN